MNHQTARKRILVCALLAFLIALLSAWQVSAHIDYVKSVRQRACRPIEEIAVWVWPLLASSILAFVAAAVWGHKALLGQPKLKRWSFWLAIASVVVTTIAGIGRVEIATTLELIVVAVIMLGMICLLIAALLGVIGEVRKFDWLSAVLLLVTYPTCYLLSVMWLGVVRSIPLPTPICGG